MGIFDKLKERMADAAAESAKKHSADLAKAMAKKSAESALSAAKDAGRKLEEALFGERDELPAKEDEDSPAVKKKRAEEMGEKLRAADKRVKEAAAREAAERTARAEKQKQTDREVEDELAALKRKLKK